MQQQQTMGPQCYRDVDSVSALLSAGFCDSSVVSFCSEWELADTTPCLKGQVCFLCVPDVYMFSMEAGWTKRRISATHQPAVASRQPVGRPNIGACHA